MDQGGRCSCFPKKPGYPPRCGYKLAVRIAKGLSRNNSTNTVNAHTMKEEEAQVIEEDVYIMGKSLRGVKLSTAVGLYTIGIFVTYITIFIIQESVFKTSHFDYGGLLVVCYSVDVALTIITTVIV